MSERTIGSVGREAGPLGDQEFEAFVARSRFSHAAIIPGPPIPTIPPGQHGDLGRASIDQLVALTREVWPANATSVRDRCRAVGGFLSYLETLHGDTWQERWEASDLAAGTRRLGRKGTAHIATYRASAGMKLMFCLRPHGLRYHIPGTDSGSTPAVRVGLSAPRRLVYESSRSNHIRWPSGLAGSAHHGCFPPGTPRSIRAAGIQGQLTVEEMVDQYPIANRAMRQLLIDYLKRRASELDYSSLRHLATRLVGIFWVAIEQMAPGQADLRLGAHVYDHWRASIGLRKDGQPRIEIDTILLAVRGLYLDIHTWAAAEPERWAEHFDKRKVELGNCGRPYGTPCVHEHACVRCPMLHVSPTMIGRLDELEADLVARRSRAHREGWLGEIEGLDLTLSHLRGKRDQTRRLCLATALVELDLPDQVRS